MSKGNYTSQLALDLIGRPIRASRQKIADFDKETLARLEALNCNLVEWDEGAVGYVRMVEATKPLFLSTPDDYLLYVHMENDHDQWHEFTLERFFQYFDVLDLDKARTRHEAIEALKEGYRNSQPHYSSH